jgi:hypothetical protein
LSFGEARLLLRDCGLADDIPSRAESESTLFDVEGDRLVLILFDDSPSCTASFFARKLNSSAFSHSKVHFFDVLMQYVHG